MVWCFMLPFGTWLVGQLTIFFLNWAISNFTLEVSYVFHVLSSMQQMHLNVTEWCKKILYWYLYEYHWMDVTAGNINRIMILITVAIEQAIVTYSVYLTYGAAYLRTSSWKVVAVASCELVISTSYCCTMILLHTSGFIMVKHFILLYSSGPLSATPLTGIMA